MCIPRVEELGVSKTPLRDALYRLQQDGLIEVRPRSGTFVSTPNAKDVEEIFDVRKALERQAVYLAMKNISKEIIQKLLQTVYVAEKAINNKDFQVFFESDRELHKTLIINSKNERLTKIMQALEAQITWVGVIIAKSSERPLQANKMHEQILKVMFNSDVDLAQNLMEKHIEEVKQITLKDFS
jgi:DNA-binding GntR family transcriptional regulator